MHNVRSLAAMVAVSALVLVTSPAHAGYKAAGYSVTVDMTNRQAVGPLGSARNTADGFQEIGCNLFVNTLGNTGGYCYATTSKGVRAVCNLSGSEQVDLARNLSSDSMLWFQWNSSNQCTYIQTGVGSSWEPKVL